MTLNFDFQSFVAWWRPKFLASVRCRSPIVGERRRRKRLLVDEPPRRVKMTWRKRQLKYSKGEGRRGWKLRELKHFAVSRLMGVEEEEEKEGWGWKEEIRLRAGRGGGREKRSWNDFYPNWHEVLIESLFSPKLVLTSSVLLSRLINAPTCKIYVNSFFWIVEGVASQPLRWNSGSFGKVRLWSVYFGFDSEWICPNRDVYTERCKKLTA